MCVPGRGYGLLRLSICFVLFFQLLAAGTLIAVSAGVARVCKGHPTAVRALERLEPVVAVAMRFHSSREVGRTLLPSRRAVLAFNQGSAIHPLLPRCCRFFIICGLVVATGGGSEFFVVSQTSLKRAESPGAEGTRLGSRDVLVDDVRVPR